MEKDNKSTQPESSADNDAGQDTLNFNTKRIAVASEQEVKAHNRGLVICVVVVLLIMAGLAVAGFLLVKEPDDTVQGQCDASEVRISGKLPGRVMTLYVEEGQRVKAGDTLVRIHSTMADARLDQAQAAVSTASANEGVASAAQKRVDAGTRKQVIDAAYEVYQQAVAASGIAGKTYERLNNLANEGVISKQKRDEAQAAYEAAKAGEAAAKSQWELTLAGAQKEDKEAASAMVRMAQGGVKVAQGGVREVKALLQDQYLVAPCDGEVTVIYPQESELVALGAPIMTIQKDDNWAVFNVRENLLKDLTLGTKIDVYIPALDKKAVMEIFYIRDMGSYANWQATKSTGSYDARTFTIKARPARPIANFRPGMSVLYQGVHK